MNWIFHRVFPLTLSLTDATVWLTVLPATTSTVVPKKVVLHPNFNVSRKKDVYQRFGYAMVTETASMGELESSLNKKSLMNVQNQKAQNFQNFPCFQLKLSPSLSLCTSSDEKNCKTKECFVNEFRCPTSGRCIPYSWLCDSEKDCPDGSDEGEKASCDVMPKSNSCDPTYFK